jgi:hypothetical protein
MQNTLVNICDICGKNHGFDLSEADILLQDNIDQKNSAASVNIKICDECITKTTHYNPENYIPPPQVVLIPQNRQLVINRLRDIVNHCDSEAITQCASCHSTQCCNFCGNQAQMFGLYASKACDRRDRCINQYHCAGISCGKMVPFCFTCVNGRVSDFSEMLLDVQYYTLVNEHSVGCYQINWFDVYEHDVSERGWPHKPELKNN